MTATKERPPQRNVGGTKGARKPNRLLKALRHVFDKPKTVDKTQAHKKLRKLWDTKPEAFMAMLRQAEREHRMGGKAGQTASVGSVAAVKEVVVAPAGKAEELIGRLLGEFAGEPGPPRP